MDSNPRSPCRGWRLGLLRRSYGKFRRANLRFAPDSPLEGGGFEPPVPGAKEPVSFAEGELRGIERGRPTKVVSLRVPMVSNPSPSRRESNANLALAVPRAVAPCHLRASVEQCLDRWGAQGSNPVEPGRLDILADPRLGDKSPRPRAATPLDYPIRPQARWDTHHLTGVASYIRLTDQAWTLTQKRLKASGGVTCWITHQ